MFMTADKSGNRHMDLFGNLLHPAPVFFPIQQTNGRRVPLKGLFGNGIDDGQLHRHFLR
nr:hypothetical protein [Caldibacillus debilis]